MKTLRTATGLAIGMVLGVLIVQWIGTEKVHTPSLRNGMSLANAAGAPGFNPNIFVDLAKKVVPFVVNISTSTTVKGTQASPWGSDDLFRRFFEDLLRRHGGGGAGPHGDDDDSEGEVPPGQPAPKMMSLGTGFIIDSAGLILTNNHVVQNADEIKIQFTEGEDAIPGEVAGRDPELDLALIKVKSKRQMTAAILGDSDSLEVGEYVIAVGNPFGQGHSVSHGIISAKNRQSPDFVFTKYIQTDAPINPGNSGGPLVNLRGEVIGINNAIDARAQGIGFAIPISSVKKVLTQLKTKGSVARGYIGVLVGPLPSEVAEKIGATKHVKAPFITHVYPGQPADRAGLKPMDVVLEINGKKTDSPADLIDMVTAFPVGEEISIKVLRGTEERIVKVKVAERPEPTKGPGAPGKKEKKKPTKSKVETGMGLEDLTADMIRDLGFSANITGVYVSTVAYGGPADKAGLARGDVIIEVEQKPVKSVEQFYTIVKEKKSYLLRVRRADPQGQDGFFVIVLDLKAKN